MSATTVLLFVSKGSPGCMIPETFTVSTLFLILPDETCTVSTSVLNRTCLLFVFSLNHCPSAVRTWLGFRNLQQNATLLLAWLSQI
jgi:hypothetical protein